MTEALLGVLDSVQGAISIPRSFARDPMSSPSIDIQETMPALSSDVLTRVTSPRVAGKGGTASSPRSSVAEETAPPGISDIEGETSSPPKRLAESS